MAVLDQFDVFVPGILVVASLSSLMDKQGAIVYYEIQIIIDTVAGIECDPLGARDSTL